MADDFTQANRRLQITTPLGPDALLLTGLSGEEGMSRLFAFEADFLGRENTVDFDAVVGKSVTVSIDGAAGKRYINGIVSRFVQAGTVGAHAQYQAEIVPWLWFLTRTSDCRIFQNKSVPDIIRQIFSDYGFADYKFNLSGSFPEWDYCVQYRETDFNFIARLMEEEGIFFFFDHEDGKHTLVLASDPGVHKPCPGMSQLRFIHENLAGDEDVVTQLRKAQEVRASRYTATDYNMETPSLDLMASAAGGDARKYELYDFPAAGGSPVARDRIEHLVRVRQEEEDASRIVFDGAGYCRTLMPGYTIEIAGAGEGGVSTFDGKYLLTDVRHHMTEPYVPGEGGGEASYRNLFTCVTVDVPFRPRRATPKPVINGIQTAVVVGPAGEEIFVDKYGRVQVQFFWDREGKREGKQDGGSSCWIRVSQGWAGKNWGMITIPRVGQEVVVSFLEGDPDCPLITGRVYNAEQMPPYALPVNGTQSGIKTRSSKGGSTANFNEIRFEDKKGSEELYIHAEKDQNIVVEHDKTEEIGHNEKIKIHQDRTEEVGHDEELRVQNDRRRTVIKNETVEIGENRKHAVGKDEGIGIGGNQDVTIDKAQRVKIGDKHTLTVGSSETISVSKSQSLSVGGDQTISVGGKRDDSVDKDCTLKVGKKFVVEAGDEITLQTGSATIQMKKDGTIVVEGNKITVKASGDLVLKGSKVAQN
jgi:type VI secretion system secreted protein VgrG